MTLGVRVHLISSSRYWVPLSFALPSEPSWKGTPRKANLTQFCICKMLGIPKELGFGFYMVLMPLPYVLKWNTNIWPLLMGYQRSRNPKNGQFGQNSSFTSIFVHFGQSDQFYNTIHMVMASKSYINQHPTLWEYPTSC